MTPEELTALMTEYIATQANDDKDDWYATSRSQASVILNGFARFLRDKGIQIENPIMKE